MIREATIQDLEEITVATEQIVRVMNEKEQNFQWDENYPNRTVFSQDIEQRQLFVYEVEEQIAGFIVVNEEEPTVYRELQWESDEVERLVIHRMAVHPDWRKKGIAKKLFLFAEGYTKQQGIEWLRVDTNSVNNKMTSLVRQLDYQMVGQVALKPELPLFNCYEKHLCIEE